MSHYLSLELKIITPEQCSQKEVRYRGGGEYRGLRSRPHPHHQRGKENGFQQVVSEYLEVSTQQKNHNFYLIPEEYCFTVNRGSKYKASNLKLLKKNTGDYPNLVI